MNISLTGDDLEAVIKSQAEQIVNLQKIVAYLTRRVGELEKEKQMWPKDVPISGTTEKVAAK